MIKKWMICLGLVLVLAPAVQAASEPKSGPDARMAGLMEAFKGIKVAPEDGALSAADKQANETAYKNADAFFDFQRLTATAIAPHKKALNADQLARYQRDFTALIRLVAFPRSGSFVQQAKVSVEPAEIHGNNANVALHGNIPEEDIDTRIVFKWENIGDTWRVTDVTFDGVSMVKDYQNQFGKLIKKDGAEGFLKKLESRLAQERKGNDA